jgi:hypothetical protein
VSAANSLDLRCPLFGRFEARNPSNNDLVTTSLRSPLFGRFEARYVKDDSNAGKESHVASIRLNSSLNSTAS